MIEPVTLTLSREDMIRVHELVVARAVSCEAAEEAVQTGLGSPNFRRPADAIFRALSESGVKSGAPDRKVTDG